MSAEGRRTQQLRILLREDLAQSSGSENAWLTCGSLRCEIDCCAERKTVGERYGLGYEIVHDGESETSRAASPSAKPFRH